MADEERREIYYMLAYDVDSGKWFAADAMLQVFTNGSGQVLAGSGMEGKWRQLEDGMEKDIDFDNTEVLSNFLKQVNEK